MREESVSYLGRKEVTFASRRALNSDPTMDDGTVVIGIENQQGIVEARQMGRIMAQNLGSTATQDTLVTTVISELARNILLYAGSGKIKLLVISEPTRAGIQIIAEDKGPGIPNIPRAMMNGFSTSGGLGLGLAGVRQIADRFSIKSKVGKGVEIDVTMWIASR